MFPFDACQIFALMVVLKSGIKFRWLMYFMVCPKDVTVVNAGPTLT